MITAPDMATSLPIGITPVQVDPGWPSAWVVPWRTWSVQTKITCIACVKIWSTTILSISKLRIFVHLRLLVILVMLCLQANKRSNCTGILPSNWFYSSSSSSRRLLIASNIEGCSWFSMLVEQIFQIWPNSGRHQVMRQRKYHSKVGKHLLIIIEVVSKI
jgi:hypothetical protein